MKNYDECIKYCDEAIETTKNGNYDYIKLGKAKARKANALFKQGKHDESISEY